MHVSEVKSQAQFYFILFYWFTLFLYGLNLDVYNFDNLSCTVYIFPEMQP